MSEEVESYKVIIPLQVFHVRARSVLEAGHLVKGCLSFRVEKKEDKVVSGESPIGIEPGIYFCQVCDKRLNAMERDIGANKCIECIRGS